MNRDEAGTTPAPPVGWALLTAACDASGITPDSDSVGTLARLAGDFETCAVVAALIRRAYRAGCTSAAPAPDSRAHLTARGGAA